MFFFVIIVFLLSVNGHRGRVPAWPFFVGRGHEWKNTGLSSHPSHQMPSTRFDSLLAVACTLLLEMHLDMHHKIFSFIVSC